MAHIFLIRPRRVLAHRGHVGRVGWKRRVHGSWAPLHLKIIVVLRHLLRHLKGRLCDVAGLAEGIYRQTQIPSIIIQGTTCWEYEEEGGA